MEDDVENKKRQLCLSINYCQKGRFKMVVLGRPKKNLGKHIDITYYIYNRIYILNNI